jgi:hypothetical protein
MLVVVVVVVVVVVQEVCLAGKHRKCILGEAHARLPQNGSSNRLFCAAPM